MALPRSELRSTNAATDNHSKCLKFQAGKKSAVGERLAQNKYNHPVALDTSRIPLVRGVETVGDYLAQQATVS